MLLMMTFCRTFQTHIAVPGGRAESIVDSVVEVALWGSPNEMELRPAFGCTTGWMDMGSAEELGPIVDQIVWSLVDEILVSEGLYIGRRSMA